MNLKMPIGSAKMTMLNRSGKWAKNEPPVSTIIVFFWERNIHEPINSPIYWLNTINL